MTTLLSLPLTDCAIQSKVALTDYTSFRVGGPAEWFLAPRTFADLKSGLSWAVEAEQPTTVLGAGSNLLISDRGLNGLVVCTRRLRHVSFDDATGQVTAAAGEPLASLAWKAAKRGWRGLEWAVGIPGTVGGAVVMNAGAHGACTADLFASADVISPQGKPERLFLADMDYRYRTSSLQKDGRIVTQATLQLEPGHDPQQVMADTSADLNQRRHSQPYHLPSCGSVFRNPEAQSAAWLIEQAGLKGYRVGRAEVAQRHANFILNCGGASASDIFTLIHHVQDRVADQWSLLLKPEVKILGDFQPV